MEEKKGRLRKGGRKPERRGDEEREKVVRGRGLSVSS